MSQTQQSIRELFITPREKMPTECNYLYFKVRSKGQEYTSTEISDDLQETIELKSIDGTLIDDDIIKKLLSIHGSKLCAGDINKGYLLDQFEKCKYIIILLSLTQTKYDFRDPGNLIKRLCGLVFLDNKPNDSMYVSLICGKPGLGSKLLNFSETISKQLGYTKMKLNSLDSPIGFYLKKGYLFDESKGSVAGNVGYNISGGPDEYDPEPDSDEELEIGSISDVFLFEYPLPERVILEWGNVRDGRWDVPYSLDSREPTFKKNMLHEGLMIPDNTVRFTTKGPLGAAIQAIAEVWCNTEGIVGSDGTLYPSGKVFVKTFEKDHFNGRQVSLTIPARELFTPYHNPETGERGVALKNVIECRLNSNELRQVVIVPLFNDIAIDFPKEEGSKIKDTRKMDGFYRNIILKAREGREEAEDARPNEYSLFDFNPEEPLACLFHQAKLRARMHGVSCCEHPKLRIDYFNEQNISKKIKLNLDVTGPERVSSIVDWYTRHSICPYPVDMCDIHGFNIPIAGKDGFYYGYIPERTKLEYNISGHFNAPYEKTDDGNFNFTLPTHSYQKANGEHGYFTRKKEYVGYKHIRIGGEVCEISPLVRTTPIRKL